MNKNITLVLIQDGRVPSPSELFRKNDLQISRLCIELML